MSLARLFMLIAIGFCLFAVGRGIALRWVRPAQPRLELLPPIVDLGVVSPGQLTKQTFLIHNIGNARLFVTGIKSSCSCAVAELSTRIIMPGEWVPLHVTFRAKGTGIIAQYVVVQTNNPAAPTESVRLSGRVVSTTNP
jgi:hypothetical protein